ncbi:MAG: hypothetical protein ACRC3B_09630, partial [Bacteroidia bacterium]
MSFLPSPRYFFRQDPPDIDSKRALIRQKTHSNQSKTKSPDSLLTGKIANLLHLFGIIPGGAAHNAVT